MSDFASNSEEQRTSAHRSRALAATAVRMVTGWGPEDAAASVIDGRDDQGLDAIAVAGEPPHVYLVQAKWSQKGKASAQVGPVQRMFAGLRLIDAEESDQFNPRGQLLAEQAKAAMNDGAVGVTLVTVLMGAEAPSSEVERELANGEAEFNTHGELVNHRFVLAGEIWDWVRADAVPSPVEITVSMNPWFDLDVPHKAYQGVVPAEHVAEWLDENDARLFERNIRNPLAGTPANEEIFQTLTEDPSLFWYFNNGVTVLCDAAEPQYSSRRNPRGGPVTLKLTGASVVNGAQTVRTVQRALAECDETATAQVGVRVIVTGGSSEFASQTTRATNRQNQVQRRDFVALDPVQAEIRADLRAEFGKSYSVRRGEMEPTPETGCSLDEAAAALACAHPNAEYASRTARSLDNLWERGARGTYDILFRPPPNAYQVWRSVVTVRRIREHMHELRPSYEGRAAAVLEHGTYLLCHLTFRGLGTYDIDDPDVAWEADYIPRVPRAVETQFALLVRALEETFPRARVHTVFNDAENCRQLAAAVAACDFATSEETPVVPKQYVKREQARKRRRPNAVPTLVDHGTIEEGAPLFFVPGTPGEQQALGEWLAEDDRRTRATWVVDRAKPLLWEADGGRHSPSGLVKLMWQQAGWNDCPVSARGTARWQTAQKDTLAALAFALQEPGEPE